MPRGMKNMIVLIFIQPQLELMKMVHIFLLLLSFLFYVALYPQHRQCTLLT